MPTAPGILGTGGAGSLINNQSNLFTLDQAAQADVTAQVVIEPVGEDDEGAAYAPLPDGIMADYVIANRYENDQHTYMAGISSPGGFAGGTAAFFRLATATTLWVCRWSAAKLFAQPEVPDPFSVSPKWVLLDVHVETRNLVVAAGDGSTPLYRINGAYFFGCRNPSQNPFGDVSYGRRPDVDDDFPRLIDLTKLVGQLAEAGVAATVNGAPVPNMAGQGNVPNRVAPGVP